MSSASPRARSKAFWVVLAVAAVLRIAFAAEVVGKGTGLEGAHPLDPWLYAMEAELILDGDLLLEEVPDRLALYLHEGIGLSTYLLSPVGRPTFHRLYGRAPLINAPLYPYALAPLLAVDPTGNLARVLQVLLSLALVAMTYSLARRVTGSERVALAAMLLFALHPTSLLYAGFLLRTTLVTTLLLLLVLVLQRFAAAPSGARAAGIGALTGALHLAKGLTPFLAPVSLAVLLLPGRRRPTWLALAATAFALAVTPLALRNLASGCSPLHTSSQTHAAVAAYNFVGADGLHLVRPTPDYLHSLVGPHDSTIDVLVAAAATHSGWGFPRLLLRKLLGFWSGYEARNNLSTALHGRLFETLRWLPVSTWSLCALALLGLPLALRRWRHTWPVLAGVGLILATCLAGVSMARYRLPAAPYLAILAAMGCGQLWRQRRRPMGLLGVLALLALLTHPAALKPTEPPGAPPTDASIPEHAALDALSRLYERVGKVPLAKDLALRSAGSHPLAGRPLGPATDPRARAEVIHLHERALELCLASEDVRGAERMTRRLSDYR